MHKILCIVGPTATGKTKLALKLSVRQPSILISADSRQVYRGLDIVTGKDHPPGIMLYGIDLVDPHQPCSVSVWYDAVIPHIKKAWKEGKQVIVVGGTGLYVKAIAGGITTLQVPINQAFRVRLQPLSIAELQTKLHDLDPLKLTSMNHSDQHNPRRLIRAIEIAHTPPQSLAIRHQPFVKLIGLKYFNNSKYRSIIHQRVLARLDQGALTETKKLMTSASPQSLSAIGYRSIVSFIEGKCSEAKMVEHWVSDELSYAKRQLTWFNKQMLKYQQLS